jgi:octaprenyl-diphosphate synthase
MSLDVIHPSLPGWLADLDVRLRALFEGEYAMLQDASVTVVGSRGKRLRPVTLFLANACFADINERSLKYAAMVELIHAASLVHDDVVDEADSRRGQPTAHVRWGNKYSVLLGDYLLARVFDIASEEAVPAILRLVAATATDMGRAVTMELTALNIRATETTYWDVIRGKTATLFGASAAIGGVVGGAAPAQQDALYRLGSAFGYAFQVADDLLDLQGGEDERGKPHGIDWQQRRATLPLLYALAHAPAKAAREMRQLWEQEVCTREHIAALQDHVEAAGGFDYGWRKVKEYQDEAVSCLDALPDTPARAALRRLCRDSFPLPVMPAAV